MNMSYKDDQIKLLELVCSCTTPTDFPQEETEVIVIYEDELKYAGLSYYGAMTLLKEMWHHIKQVDEITAPDGRKGLRIFSENNVNDLLSSLKYPNAEEDYYSELADMQSGVSIIPKKISLKIDDKKGIYRTDKPELRYPLGKDKKRMKLIKYLLLHEHVGLKALMTKTNQEKSVVITSINAINDMIKEKIDTRQNLILHLETGGYSMNKEDFEIK